MASSITRSFVSEFTRKRSSSLTGGFVTGQFVKLAKVGGNEDAHGLVRRQFAVLRALTSKRASETKCARENATRNRYPNVLANDNSRVRLAVNEGESDYVNASFVSDRHVAAQAPLPHTVEHFWQMAVQLQSRVIVCLTKFEFGRATCYFPALGCTQKYGKMIVSTRRSVQFGRFITVRTLFVQKENSDGPPHRIVHLYYSGWPDFGVPPNTDAILQLNALMHAFDKQLMGPQDKPDAPFITHCSAGLGRAGTFIATSLMIDQIEEGHLDHIAEGPLCDDDDDAEDSASLSVASAAQHDSVLSPGYLAGHVEPAPLTTLDPSLMKSDSSLNGPHVEFVNLNLMTAALSSTASKATFIEDSSKTHNKPLATLPLASSPSLLSAIFRVVYDLRQRRTGMVQTDEQYSFIAKVSAASVNMRMSKQQSQQDQDQGSLASSSISNFSDDELTEI